MFYQPNMNLYNQEKSNLYLNNNHLYNNNFHVAESKKKFISCKPVTGNCTTGQVNWKDNDFLRIEHKGKRYFHLENENGVDHHRSNRFNSAEKDSLQDLVSVNAKNNDYFDLKIKSPKTIDEWVNHLIDFSKEIIDPEISLFNSGV